jgi:ABC-2 type transport system ATP-binding protein
MLQKDVGQLSKGYRQRVGLAATLIHDPDVLVLDEPTSGLDPSQIIEIRELIREIGREKTVILSTHILPEVEATCSRVLIIADGRIVASGTTEELTRMSAGKVTARVAFKAAPAVVEPALRRVQGVTEVHALDAPRPGLCRYEVVGPAGAELEESLFALAVENRWTMVELHSGALSLEQVFLRLTTGEKQS